MPSPSDVIDAFFRNQNWFGLNIDHHYKWLRQIGYLSQRSVAPRWKSDVLTAEHSSYWCCLARQNHRKSSLLPRVVVGRETRGNGVPTPFSCFAVKWVRSFFKMASFLGYVPTPPVGATCLLLPPIRVVCTLRNEGNTPGLHPDSSTPLLNVTFQHNFFLNIVSHRILHSILVQSLYCRPLRVLCTAWALHNQCTRAAINHVTTRTKRFFSCVLFLQSEKFPMTLTFLETDWFFHFCPFSETDPFSKRRLGTTRKGTQQNQFHLLWSSHARTDQLHLIAQNAPFYVEGIEGLLLLSKSFTWCWNIGSHTISPARNACYIRTKNEVVACSIAVLFNRLVTRGGLSPPRKFFSPPEKMCWI